DEQRDDREQQEDRDDRQQHRVEGAGAAPLVDGHPPAQPDERPQVMPVHEAASSSQLSLGGAWWSAPAFCRKMSSSEPRWRMDSSDACSTSSPLTMIPTCVQSRSTISRMCDVRKTVDPRATNPASKSRITREVTASTPSNGSSRNNRSGFGNRAAAMASFFFI